MLSTGKSKGDAVMELILEHLDKCLKQKRVVKDVNVIMKEGVHGLLGANGSGKTTLMRMICGLLPADEGSVCLDEIDMNLQYDTYASQLGYMPQHFGFYPHYTVKAFLEYMAIIKHMTKDYANQRIIQLLSTLHLEDQKKTKMKHLSGGMLRRVGIAAALLNEPKVLILDEPTAGLDPKERIIFRNLIASLSETTIVLLSTHIVSDIETIADDILVMKEGEIILHDTCEELLQTMKDKVWYLKTDKEAAIKLMETHVIVKSHHVQNQMELRIVSDEKPHEAAQLVKPDLDDLYLYHFKEGVSL